jgi:rhamnulokinase
MTDTAHFIAVDLGAASGRVLLGRWDGARFAIVELHRFANGPVEVLGHLHWDLLRLWSEIKQGLHRYAQQFDAPLAGIGVDSWGVDFGLLDRHGRLLGNPYHYRDRRNAGMAERVAELIPPAELFAQTGLQVLPFNTLYQLYSMARSDDPQLQAADTLLMIPDLLHYWLTGRAVGEYSNASTTQMLDCRSRQWLPALLDRLGLPAAILPPLVAPGTLIEQLRGDVLRELGLRHPVPVIAPATHDTASAVAAVPRLDSASAYISSGTWSLVGVEIPQPITSPAAQQLNVTNEGGVAGTIRLLKNVAGLWLLQASQHAWQRAGTTLGWEQILAEAAAAPPLHSLIDPDDPALHNPDDMPAAIREFCRRTEQPQPQSIGAVARCCLESLALRYRWVIQALERLTGKRITTIRIVGGGSQNRLLCQITADACGRPVIAGPVEATALGNIMLQAIATGYLADIEAGRAAIAASVAPTRFEPQPTVDWERAFERFCRLLDRPQP